MTAEAIRSSETSIQTRPTRRYIPEDDIFFIDSRSASVGVSCLGKTSVTLDFDSFTLQFMGIRKHESEAPNILGLGTRWVVPYPGKKRVLRRIFGPKRDDVTGDWRTLHNEELHNLYSSPNIIRMIKSRRMRGAGHAARMGETRNAYRILAGKPEGK
jgi:hypothetical protein